MNTAARMIMTPSSTALKNSALWCPKGWLASGGIAATRIATRAAAAVARFTVLSSASDRSATEPVIHQAITFRPSTRQPSRRLPTASFKAVVTWALRRCEVTTVLVAETQDVDLIDSNFQSQYALRQPPGVPAWQTPRDLAFATTA